ncbi:MAG: hypothetical protein ABIP69_01930 [Ferruginibacter sp.]
MRLYSLCIVVLFTFTSCFKETAKITGIRDKSPTITKINYEDREILFLGMTHLAKRKFYKNAKIAITDLESKGFITYVESVSIIIDNESIIDTVYAKKVRKIVGLDITISYDKIKNIFWKAFRTRFNLVGQPPYRNLGVMNYKYVDVPYNTLIDLYEKKYGIIEMDSCDFKTDLGRTYKCKLMPVKNRNDFNREFIYELRNMFVGETIKQSKEKKILIVYGKEHLEGIKNYLEETNRP